MLMKMLLPVFFFFSNVITVWSVGSLPLSHLSMRTQQSQLNKPIAMKKNEKNAKK